MKRNRDGNFELEDDEGISSEQLISSGVEDVSAMTLTNVTAFLDKDRLIRRITTAPLQSHSRAGRKKFNSNKNSSYFLCYSSYIANSWYFWFMPCRSHEKTYNLQAICKETRLRMFSSNSWNGVRCLPGASYTYWQLFTLLLLCSIICYNYIWYNEHIVLLGVYHIRYGQSPNALWDKFHGRRFLRAITSSEWFSIWW